MERDTIAFRIDHHRAEAVLPDLLSLPQNISAVRSGRIDRFVQPSFHQEINQRPIWRGPIINASAVAANAETSRRALFFMRQKPVFYAGFRTPWYFLAENGRIKPDRSAQVRDRYVYPAKRVSAHALF
jgi:hypothetical protein